jgi:hypothetical protein
MISSLPPYNATRMALLPHKVLSIQDKSDIIADGWSSGTAKWTKILEKILSTRSY